ncbi:MAG: EamA family transporter [Rhodospirillaceae bacterium]|nr:EamA family transporter [Rhodospirillaceae bacterium]MBT7485900.1 EamA family transporter [Rhodospirillales bacterium]MBT4701428.1 EamA family transporter [Rhodospirillaceae bacterium]MBT5033144.1 EamA family transporter [Rhodospirillaceae bacterium]MBT6219242.1 EamA family transporter [Rhodospirillaceae bacterium]
MLCCLAVVWSSSVLFIKIGVETVPPMSLAAGRILITTVILYVIFLWRRDILPMEGALWRQCFVLAFFGNTLPYFLIMWGEVDVDSALAAILLSVMPLATLVLAHIFTTDEKFTPLKVAGVVVGFIGVVILVGPDALGGLGDHLVRQLAVAGGAFCFAIQTVMARRLPKISPLTVSVIVMICALVQALPLAFIVDWPITTMPSAISWGAMICLGVFSGAIALIIYFYLVAQRGATYVALNNFLLPPLGVFWGFLFLDERVAPQALIALGVILIGIWLSTYKPKNQT